MSRMPGLGSGRPAAARSIGGAVSEMTTRREGLPGGKLGGRKARLLHVQRRRRSPDHAGELAGRAGEARIVRLVEPCEREKLQSAGLDQQGGGGAVAAERVLDGARRSGRVGDPEGVV